MVIKGLMEWMSYQEEFLQLMIIRIYLKLVYKYCRENNLLDMTVDEVNQLELPFKTRYISTKFPSPHRLKLNSVN